MRKRSIMAVLVFMASVIWCASASASETAPAPGWHVFSYAQPTNLPAGGTGTLILKVYNDGGASSTEGPTVVDTLPEGLTATGGAGCTGTKVVICQLGPIATHENLVGLRIPVDVAADASGELLDAVRISGGGGVASVTTIPLTVSSNVAGLGVSNLEMWASSADGRLDTQAGSHPYDLDVAFSLNSREGPLGYEPAGGEARTIDVKLPPGLVGEPGAVPQCPRALFDSGEESGEYCPADSFIGMDGVELYGGVTVEIPVFNLPPPPNVAAEFGFGIASEQVFIDARVRSGGDYGITVHSNNLPQLGVLYNFTKILGVPAAQIHDQERRGEGCIPDGYGQCGVGIPVKPLLTLPTSCGTPESLTAEIVGTWQEVGAKAQLSALTRDEAGEPAGLSGCERLVHFNPTISLAPDTSSADTPAGLTTDLKVPQEVNPEGLATSGLKDTTVTLPEGVVINPGQATGLVACQPSEENRGGPEAEDETEDGPPSCPAASKVGTDEISTPLLPDKLVGNVYILQPNPPNLQLLVAASGDGVNLKLIGNVHLNETTGQLTTTFENTPDTPFTEFKLSFSGGAQAALATPTECGTYESTAEFTPWSTPFVSNAFETSAFQISSGPDGTPCANPLPFTPQMTAGATTDQAGGYTDFTMLLTRGDGQQRISSLQFKTPEGLLGMIANVSLCGEPQAGKGECSAASQIGHTVTTAGPGPYPFEVPQAGGPPAPIYLTGPYQGAPYGLSIVVPVVAGPFNLGTVVVRARIEVDPHTSQLTITTGELPRILDGIPTDLRAIDAVIDRPDFMFNPTNCEPMSFAGTATSTEGTTAAISSHFQVGSCQALKFAPNFKVSTSGKTSKIDGASLDAKIVYPTGNLGDNQASSQSNIKTVKVELPKKLPSRLTTLQKACTAGTFEANPANCPSASLVGHATAVTPVLPVPLNGPVYFVSHGGEAFPSLIVVLRGDGVTVDLVGTTFISNTSITSSTFKQVPDVPIASFELVLPEGPYSALAANGNLCKTKLVMPTAFTAQNGAVINQSTKVSVTGCPKAKKATKRPTRAQKLAKALKSCGKDHSKKKRAACEKQARKKYGPTKTKKKRKK